MNIEIQGTMAWITGDDEKLNDEVLQILIESCSFMPSKARFIEEAYIKKMELNGKKNPVFDRESLRVEFFNPVSRSFPAGLAWTIRDILLAYDISADIKCNFQSWLKDEIIDMLIEEWKEAWKHQTDAILSAGLTPRGIFSLPPAAGKTWLGVKLWELWGKKLCLILAPTKPICNQWVEEFNKHFPEYKVGTWFGDHKSKIRRINVMTFSKAAAIFKFMNDTSGLKLLTRVPFVLVDEMHIIGPGKYGKPNQLYNTIMQFKKTENIYGLSATPEMRDGNIFQTAAIGEILLKVSVEELKEKGILVPERVKFIPTRPIYLRARKRGTKVVKEIDKDGKEILDKNGNVIEKKVEVETKLAYYRFQYDKVITHNEDRNMRAIKKALKLAMEKRPVLTFVKTLEHMRIIFNILHNILRKNQMELTVAYTHGEDRNQSEKINAFKNNEINILIVTPKLMGMGVNIPRISGIINCVGEKSLITLEQMIGRGRRQFKNKFDCIIIEFADATEPFSGFSVKRLRHYSDQGADIDLSECRWLDRLL